MDKEFVTLGSAKIMVDNVTYEQAEEISKEIENKDYVSSVAFDDSEEHYHNVAAMFEVTFIYPEKDEACVKAQGELLEDLSAYDLYVSSSVGDTESETLAAEMQKIIVVVAIVIIAVLLFTSKTYAEVPVLLLTFGSAALLNMGTNYWFGTISFISNSVTVVLQLALAIDYAVILCNHFTEEHELLPTREACIEALNKSIPEISSSCLTTVSGLLALCFMQFRIGQDLGVVLVKAIMFSIMSVFLLMPGLLMVFSKLMDKTRHKNFVPKITFIARFDFWSKYFVPPIFVAAIIVGFYFSNKCPYVYGYSTLSTPIQNENQIAEQKITDNFGSTNLMALIIPSGDYDKEEQLIKNLDKYDEIESVTALANAEALDGYTLTDKLTARDFSELLDVDYEVAVLLYTAYAVHDENYGKVISGIDSYSVPLIDMFFFLYDEVQEGYVTLDAETMATLEDAHEQMSNGRMQLEGEKYSRILVHTNLPEESDDTFAFLDTLREEGQKLYGSDVYVVGDSTSDHDLSTSFSRDNMVISILTALFVIIVLLFTFQSVGMPVLLIVVIQGSIWLNFSFPYLESSNLFFMSYLIVSSIQMGANIDYAIVISSRYLELKKELPLKEAMIDTLNFAFHTIVTSGSILAIAGFLIGQMTSDPAISAIGECLGRGTLISIVLVLCVLPQILVLGDIIIEKSKFAISHPVRMENTAGRIFINGHITGHINGAIEGFVHGYVQGEVTALVKTGTLKNESEIIDMEHQLEEHFEEEAKEEMEGQKDEEK